MIPSKRNSIWLPYMLNDLFDANHIPTANTTTPAINIKESDSCYTLELASPGMKKDDFDININNDGNLTVKMEKKQEENEEGKNTRFLRREFAYMKYAQTFIIPENVEKGNITANVADGVLTIKLPKQVEEKTKVARQIPIG